MYRCCQNPGIQKSKDIRARILSRIDHWKDDLIGVLVEDTCGTRKARGGRARSISDKDREKHASMVYERTVKSGHLRVAVRQAIDQGKGGVLHINSMDSKSGRLVLAPT